LNCSESDNPKRKIMTKRTISAEGILLRQGWLSQLPAKFQDEVRARGKVQRFEPGTAVYRFNDPPGGVYGLIDGTLAISLTPALSAPRFIQLGIVGAWAGEGPFFTGEPRRAEMRAVTHCLLFHLPLDAMERLAERDSQAARYFARMTVAHFDVLARVIDDLLIPKASKRIAAVLHRADWLGARSIPISQEDLGGMANASRKQVNAALAHFETQKWIVHSYRSIEIRDAEALLRFASGIDG
jgi:CRP-like cAMP-binding protein